jgi:iron complex transport system substrate-binding protein
MKKFILAASVLVAVYSCKKEEGGQKENTTEATSEAPKSNNKIVTLNGGITEIVRL